MKRSRVPSSRLTIWARSSPAFSSASMRARDAAVNAVSAPAKNAERTSDKRTMAPASQRFIERPSSMATGSAPALARQERPDLIRIYAGRDEAPADAARQDEGEPAGLHLLVLIHGSEKLVGRTRPARHIGEPRRETDRSKLLPDPLRLRGRTEPQPGREAEGLGHADRDRLAMDEPGPIIGDHALQRVAEGMAQIEKRPFALLALVG